jgi:hypothetical protein
MSGGELAAAAMAKYAVNKSVVRLRRGQLGALPPALAETLPFLPRSRGVWRWFAGGILVAAGTIDGAQFEVVDGGAGIGYGRCR